MKHMIFAIAIWVAITLSEQTAADTMQPLALGPVTIVIEAESTLLLIDPKGDQSQYRPFGRPDIVVLTSDAATHLSVDTMIGLLRRDTVVLAPRSVIENLPLMISNNIIAPFEIGDTQVVDGITFTAIPLDTIPNDTTVYDRDRGDIGVLVEHNGASGFF